MKLKIAALALFLIGATSGMPAIAITHYACESWKGSPNSPTWLLDDPKPFVMLRDGESLHLEDGWHKPITITKFAFHNELIDIYGRTDEFGTTTMYYFKHATYTPETYEKVDDPTEVLLVRAAFEPEWMLRTRCYKRK